MLDGMRRELPDAAEADHGGGFELVRAAIGGARLPADVARALPVLVRELPGAARDLRLVLRNLARLTERDGELTRLAREHARLAAARTADLQRPRGSRPAARGRGQARGKGARSS